jgi:hypothetical protein
MFVALDELRIVDAGTFAGKGDDFSVIVDGFPTSASDLVD